ncbi:phage tail sheath family protein [Lysinibacillus telephonicus]|uniref:phage tail sheath family protein n=1 Tax=Lysinibacillus telephonicus TaxID=1714840 RepID=UPI003BA2FA39
MTYQHGVSTLETSSDTPVITTMIGLPVAFGTAPINQVPKEKRPINKPILCYTYSEATSQLGFDSNFSDYTLCEAIKSQFKLFQRAPIVFINVLDPEKHFKVGEPKVVEVTDGEAVVKVKGILPETVVLKNEDGTTTYQNTENETLYELEFDSEGYLHIFTQVAPKITVDFKVIDPEAVTAADIIGGTSTDGKYKGLELINHVFPLFRVVPGTIFAPKFGTDPNVASVIGAKSNNINGLFKAIGLCDLPTDTVKNYTQVEAYKTNNNISSTHQIALWPKVSLEGEQYHMSTQLAGLINQVDSSNDNVPYVSPSNKNLQMDSAVLEDGTEIVLGQDQAAYLNGEGIGTALNFVGGWKFWGNRTAAYPQNKSPKDSFIPVRRMMNYIQNTLILDYWAKVDSPTNTKLIESVIDDVNIWLNGLSARGQLLGGRVEFLKEDNPQEALIDGKVKFRVYATPPTPAREIKFLVEFDVAYFETLFAA